MKLSEKKRAILGVLSPGFGGITLPQYIKDYLANGLGALTLFGSNTPDLETAATLIAEIRTINPDCVISIDEESGDVTRIWAKLGSPFPSAYLLGRLDDVSFTERVFTQLGANLAKADIDLTFGPVLDLLVSSDNPIVGIRSFGEDEDLVARHGSAAVRGLLKAGVASSPKHFPGHGRPSEDSHHDLPTILAPYELLYREDMAPFKAAISNGAKAMMVGHLLVPDVDSEPASLSKKWCTEILRGALNFQGVIVTDALDMGALGGLEAIHKSALRAVRAGADLLCLSGIDDQRLIIQSILEHAELELDDSDLVALAASRERVKSLRRSGLEKVGIERLPVESLKSGLEVNGAIGLASGSLAILSLEASPTVASGQISWGLVPSLTSIGVELGEFDASDNLIIQFRDAWRDSVIMDRLSMLEKSHPNAIYVDFGWPTRGFAPKNIVRAFGASRAHSDAVAKLLLSDK